MDFSKMTNLSDKLRKQLDGLYNLTRAFATKDLVSFDETRKWLLKFEDGNEVEAVFIPEKTRGTLCISSQVGCTLTCKFCHTGTQKLVRNLEAHEILAQFMYAKDMLGDWPATKEERKITNIVMMGMGEPLLNYDNVAKALKVIMDPDGLGLSKRKITLSTSGIVPFIERCGVELGVNLAISLHAVTDELRNHLVPINKKYPIKELLHACKHYPALKNRERITFEYVMLNGVNDSDADARELVKLIKGIPAKINLIPFNPWPGAPFECSTQERIKKFVSIIEEAGYMSPVRTPRGQDIMAACGQLKSESLRPQKSATA
jgi:23S rRNA (adenine2503-C2)-methyltransferase